MNTRSENKPAPAYAKINGEYQAVVIVGWYGLPTNESEPAYVRVTNGRDYFIVGLEYVHTRTDYHSLLDSKQAGRSYRAHRAFVRRHYSGVALIDAIVPHIGTLKPHATRLHVWSSHFAFSQIGA